MMIPLSARTRAGEFFVEDVPFGAKKNGIRLDSAKVGLTEFESVTPSPPDLYANQLRYSPMNEWSIA